MTVRKSTSKPKSRSGTSRTEAQLIAAGWAPRFQPRFRAEEYAELLRRCKPGETPTARIRRWLVTKI
jgi:hypothetical protein